MWLVSRSAILDVLQVDRMPPKRGRKKKVLPSLSDSDSPDNGSIITDKPSENTGNIVVVQADVHKEPDSDVQLVDDVDVNEDSEPEEADPLHNVAVKKSDSPQDEGKKRKQRIVSYIFSEEQEKDIGEWFREHECLYNRRHKLYKDAAHKHMLYAEKAQSLTPKCTCK